MSWLTSGEPFSEQFQDYYFSTDGGLEESEYVFLHQNGFPQRFKTPAKKHFSIGETGFGTGLNFLVSIYHFLQHSHVNSTLYYLALEKYPLDKKQLTQIYGIFNQNWPMLAPLNASILEQYPQDIISAGQTLHFDLLSKRVQLKLLIGDACHSLQDYIDAQQKVDYMDAWYLDGFSPAKNPQMWQLLLFKQIARLSHQGTTLSSFTSAGKVRRGLITAGFSMDKAPGLGKKREILRGVKE